MASTIYYLLAGLGSALFCVLVVVFLKTPFQKLAITSVKQLDLILDQSLDEVEKDKQILRNLGHLLGALFLNIILFILSVLAGILPAYLYVEFTVSTADISSLYFYLSLTIGSLVLFIFKKKGQDYNYWSKLFHRLVLQHYNLGNFLFRKEKKKHVKEGVMQEQPFTIVTGLARAGTTALTNLIYDPKYFHSISYANMPFLMSPNRWKKVYNPKNSKMKERAHKDNVLFSYTSIEALEEYFFKAQLHDAYIHPTSIDKHEVSLEIYENYLAYQQLFKAKDSHTTYIAKNNNFMLRYESLRTQHKAFKVLLLFREPVAHARSLMRQDQNFREEQDHEPFILEYMDFLGHHEFGHHQKAFDFKREKITEYTNKDTLNYWLAIWVNYYSYILSLPEDSQLLLIDYDKLLHQPKELKSQVAKFLKTDLSPAPDEKFVAKKHTDKSEELDPKLLEKALEIFDKLKKLAE